MKSIFANEVQIRPLTRSTPSRFHGRSGWKNVAFAVYLPRPREAREMSNAEFAHRLRTTRFGLFGSIKALQILEAEHGDH